MGWVAQGIHHLHSTNGNYYRSADWAYLLITGVCLKYWLPLDDRERCSSPWPYESDSAELYL